MYTIGQVAKFLGVSRDTLKFYEEKNLVKPKQDIENGYRKYNHFDIYDITTVNFYREMDIEIKKFRNYENYISIYKGLVVAISILILSIVFLYFNPHSSKMLDKEVYMTVFFMPLPPSFLAVIRRKAFMIFYGIWLLQRTLYLSVAAISTLWNLYILS